MKTFEKQESQKIYKHCFLKKQIFSGTVSVRLFKFGFLKLVSSQKQNVPYKKDSTRVRSAEQKNQISSFQKNTKFKTNIIKKKLLNGYSKIHELKLVTIELASPEKIQSWAEKELPNGKIFGEVTNANTFHYRTFKPSKGGLFCERIFGPIKDFECACGKRQRPTAIESKKILEHEQTSRSFCPNCDVEYTWSIIRRYQLGYIKFNAPVAHLWYFKTNPSYLSILFDMKRKHLESIIYCTETITIENTWKYSEQNSVLNRSPKDLYLTWQKLFNMEKSLQKHQLMHENQQEEQKQRRNRFRKLSFTQNKISPHVNWQKFDRKTFLKNLNNFEIFEKTPENKADFSKIAAKTKHHILSNISKQKQKKLLFLLFEEIWKKFLQKSYKNALFFMYSQESLSNQFFQNIRSIFNIFLFSSKKNKKFSDFSQSSIVLDFEVLKKELVSSNFFFREKTKKTLDQKNFETCGNKKKYWKSFFFLFEFANFFIQHKKTKIKSFHSISKKDFLFLINVLPFLKQILRFKNLKFLKTNSKKIHLFLVQNILSESKNDETKAWLLPMKNKFFYKTSKKLNSREKSFLNFFDTQNEFQKIKPFFSESHFSPLSLFFQEKFEKQNSNFFFALQKKSNSKKIVETTNPVQETLNESIFLIQNTDSQNKISSFLELTFDSHTDQKSDSILLNQLFPLSSNFNKLLAFLKSYYEVDFCSLVQKQIFDCFENQINFFGEKNLKNDEFKIFSEQSFNVFFNNSRVFSLYEKVCFDFFSLFFHFLKSDRISIFQNTFENFSEFLETTRYKTYFWNKTFRIRESLFFSLKYLPSLFFFFSESEIQRNKTENKANDSRIANHSRIEILHENNDFSLSQKQQNPKKATMFISNKPLFSRMKFNEKKKEIQNNQIQKFFQFDSVSDDFGLDFCFQKKSKKKSKLVSKKVYNSFFQVANGHKKTEPFVSEHIKAVNQKKPTSQKNSILKIDIKKNQQSNETSHFLKNRISTIAYNYAWSNDSDWKYFVYYNSFFLYEFQDSPVFLYSSLFPLKGGTKNQSFMSSGSATFGESFSSFFSWSIDSLPKNFFVGAGILEKLLTEYTSFELRKMTKQHQILLPKMNQVLRFLKQNSKTKKDSLKIQKYFQKREHIIRRLKFLRKFSRRNSNPTFMILRNLPVLPPDLRPILKLQNQIAASDLNRFYQRIIYRNDRLKKFSKDSATNQSFEIKYAQRLLQEAVDNLIQNGKGSVKAETNSRGQPLKSLSEILKGKQGRFRQYLLGKRVDYSGRSVIVVGPELKLYECGLPREMAFELFLPFLIQYILQNKLARTVIGAKTLLKSDSNFTLHLLHKVMKNIPVLLNRAPTLHRLGFQAFLPKLIEGRAILLHPMVCPAFNADFDGDQMAVHIPLTVEARTEAWKFMLSTNNLMNSATGEAILLPSQDMVLGCYYLTLDFQSKFAGVRLSNSLKKQNFQTFIVQNKSFLFFKNLSSVITAYQRQEICLHTPVWVRWNAGVDFGNEFSKPIEIRLQTNGVWEGIQSKYTTFFNQQNKQLSKTIRTTPGRILMNFMIQECSVD